MWWQPVLFTYILSRPHVATQHDTCLSQWLTRAIHRGSVDLALLMKKEKFNFYHRLVQDVDNHF